MHPKILRVHDIESSIRDVGLEYYVDRLLQDMVGNYYYIENHMLDRDAPENHMGWSYVVVNREAEGGIRVFKWYYRIVSIPEQLAYFIIDCLRIKSLVMQTGNSDYGGPHGGKMQVIVPAGKELMGQKLETAKEIPAELGPVVIERL